MKTKTKMPKAMYGKTMMKSGGVKKMKDGGAMSKLEKGIRKAAGYNVIEGITQEGDKYTVASKMNPGGKFKQVTKTEDAYGNKTKKKTIEEGFPKARKGGSVKKKMMTGGMVNSNANVSYQKISGSKGVTSGVNSKVSASNTASSKGSGRANTPPSQAAPAAKKGGSVKMKRGGMIKRK